MLNRQKEEVAVVGTIVESLKKMEVIFRHGRSVVLEEDVEKLIDYFSRITCRGVFGENTSRHRIPLRTALLATNSTSSVLKNAF